MRSLIQLAGRVRRHRAGACRTANLRVFNTNLRHCLNPNAPAFCRPGFESKEYPLVDHHLDRLLSASERDVIDARPRITVVPPEQFQPNCRLVDLEHARMRDMMLPVMAPSKRRGPPDPQAKPTPLANAALWWSQPASDALLTAVLPQQQPFRRDDMPRVDLLLRVLEDDDEGYKLTRLLNQSAGRVALYETVDHLLLELPDNCIHGPGIHVWGETDYMKALRELANARGMRVSDCAKKFGTVTLPEIEKGWRFHPSLGFAGK